MVIYFFLILLVCLFHGLFMYGHDYSIQLCSLCLYDIRFELKVVSNIYYLFAFVIIYSNVYYLFGKFYTREPNWGRSPTTGRAGHFTPVNRTRTEPEPK
jgi:hypothetical protein